MATRGRYSIDPSGLARRSAEDNSRAPHSSPPRRKKRQTQQEKEDKAEEKKASIPKLSAPLSELTKDSSEKIRDMKAWVHRPSEVRYKEVKKDGFIGRPMNSFMLYRAAYSARVQNWCKAHNHQVVSSIAGTSWGMETTEIKQLYTDLAKIERDNHKKAHPEYVFKPKKNTLSRKRKEAAEPSEDEKSGLDGDFDYRPAGERRRKMKPDRRESRREGYPVNSIIFNDRGYSLVPQQAGMHRSSYHITNPGKPLPESMSGLHGYGQYYQTTVHPSQSGVNIEDVRIRRTLMPRSYRPIAPPIVGLPNAHHYELLNDSLSGNLDPLLDLSSAPYPDQSGNSFITDQQFGQFNEEELCGSEPLRDGEYPAETFQWHGESLEPHVDLDDAEFTSWMDATNNR